MRWPFHLAYRQLRYPLSILDYVLLAILVQKLLPLLFIFFIPTQLWLVLMLLLQLLLFLHAIPCHTLLTRTHHLLVLWVMPHVSLLVRIALFNLRIHYEWIICIFHKLFRSSVMCLPDTSIRLLRLLENFTPINQRLESLANFVVLFLILVSQLRRFAR